MQTLADSIAACVLAKYNSLPARCKVHSTDRRREWTIVAGIVLSTGQTAASQDPYQDADQKLCEDHAYADSTCASLTCVSLATGMKCLPRSKISTANGNVLHDWHAEILCIRGFNRWLLDECESFLHDGHSRWLELCDRHIGQDGASSATDAPPTPPFRLKSSVAIHMFVSTAPCGDASMELIMAAQPDATPWEKPAPSTVPGDMLGRGQFDQLGAVRRKPARPDAPITWSKSCSDKLAAKQCTSLLSSTTAGLIESRGCYLQTLVLPASEYVELAIERSFSARGRLRCLASEDIQQRWQQLGYHFYPFTVSVTKYGFDHAKHEGAVPSNLAVLSTGAAQEVLINGVLQGRKQSDPRGASCVSRRRISEKVIVLQAKIMQSAITVTEQNPQIRYAEMKAGSSGARASVKHDLRSSALHPWKVNDGDDGWIV